MSSGGGQGTAFPVYQPTWHRDSCKGGLPVRHMGITSMEEYKGKSCEELRRCITCRLEDWMAGVAPTRLRWPQGPASLTDLPPAFAPPAWPLAASGPSATFGPLKTSGSLTHLASTAFATPTPFGPPASTPALPPASMPTITVLPSLPHPQPGVANIQHTVATQCAPVGLMPCSACSPVPCGAPFTAVSLSEAPRATGSTPSGAVTNQPIATSGLTSQPPSPTSRKQTADPQADSNTALSNGSGCQDQTTTSTALTPDGSLGGEAADLPAVEQPTFTLGNTASTNSTPSPAANTRHPLMHDPVNAAAGKPAQSSIAPTSPEANSNSDSIHQALTTTTTMTTSFATITTTTKVVDHSTAGGLMPYVETTTTTAPDGQVKIATTMTFRPRTTSTVQQIPQPAQEGRECVLSSKRVVSSEDPVFATVAHCSSQSASNQPQGLRAPETQPSGTSGLVAAGLSTENSASSQPGSRCVIPPRLTPPGDGGDSSTANAATGSTAGSPADAAFAAAEPFSAGMSPATAAGLAIPTATPTWTALEVLDALMQPTAPASAASPAGTASCSSSAGCANAADKAAADAIGAAKTATDAVASMASSIGSQPVTATAPLGQLCAQQPGLATAAAKPKPDWTEHTAPDGRKYYYNHCTKKSIWGKPEELMTGEEKKKNDSMSPWKEFTAPDGRKYFHNLVTKVSRWTLPVEAIHMAEQSGDAGSVDPMETSLGDKPGIATAATGSIKELINEGSSSTTSNAVRGNATATDNAAGGGLGAANTASAVACKAPSIQAAQNGRGSNAGTAFQFSPLQVAQMACAIATYPSMVATTLSHLQALQPQLGAQVAAHLRLQQAAPVAGVYQQALLLRALMQQALQNALPKQAGGPCMQTQSTATGTSTVADAEGSGKSSTTLVESSSRELAANSDAASTDGEWEVCSENPCSAADVAVNGGATAADKVADVAVKGHATAADKAADVAADAASAAALSTASTDATEDKNRISAAVGPATLAQVAQVAMSIALNPLTAATTWGQLHPHVAAQVAAFLGIGTQ